MDKNTFHVIYITDDNYVMPTCVSIVSLIKNKPASMKYCVNIIADKVSEKNKNIFRELHSKDCEINIIDTDGAFYKELNSKFWQSLKDGKTSRQYISASVTLKLNISNILKNVDKVLYLDSDLIINKDISELFELDISSFYAAVARRPGFINKPLRYTFSSLRYSTGIPNNCYFNSGVMLLNLKKMRLENVTEKLIDIVRNAFYPFIDQDPLNEVFLGKVLFVSYIYNFNAHVLFLRDFQKLNKEEFSNKYADEKDCIQDQKIFHFSGIYKPWKYHLPWITDIFLKYYYVSPYKKELLKLKSPMPELIKAENAFKEWRFPREKIPKDKLIIIYGAGSIGLSFYFQLQDTSYCKIALLVDRNYELINKENGMFKIPVSSPEEIQNHQYDYVLIAIERAWVVEVVKTYLNNLGVPNEKIITLV